MGWNASTSASWHEDRVQPEPLRDQQVPPLHAVILPGRGPNVLWALDPLVAVMPETLHAMRQTLQPNSWSDWQSAPSRPTSAKSQAGQVASTPQTARRLSNASGYEMIPVRADSARSTRTPEHHSLEEQIIASPDFGRRCVEEELSEPVLTRIPNSIATQLEKQVATAIGLRGRARLVPRLPRSVVSCKHGSDCCWRWLARAALEEIWGSSLATLSLAECVKKMKEDTDKQQAACNKAIQSVRSCSFHLSFSLSLSAFFLLWLVVKVLRYQHPSWLYPWPKHIKL